MLKSHARLIWDAAVGAVQPSPLVEHALAGNDLVQSAERILVVGAGKAGPGMALGLEAALAARLDRVEGLLNVPEGMAAPLRKVRLHPGRPVGVNEPTAAGVAGAERMLNLLATAGPKDVAVCLLSGGGSALLPAPVNGITLTDKLAVTKLLHRCGATIDEMNCVRKHLSRIKGGRLAEAFAGRQLLSLIISDVVGDPLDVIASGPTAADPTTFADAIAVLEKFQMLEVVPQAVRMHFERGVAGAVTDTPKRVKPNIMNQVIGSNRLALDAAKKQAERLGYHVLDLGVFIEGETREVATAVAGIVRSIRVDGVPSSPPVCILLGGETTVTMGGPATGGKGGRNQEFVLALLAKLGEVPDVVALSGGTDGEDGPTDAAGAIGEAATLRHAAERGFSAHDHLTRHDAYPFFNAVGGLLQTGLTGTNVMDVRVILVK